MSLPAVFLDGATPAPLRNPFVIKALPAPQMSRRRITRCRGRLSQPLPSRRLFPGKTGDKPLRQAAAKYLMRLVVHLSSARAAVL